MSIKFYSPIKASQVLDCARDWALMCEDPNGNWVDKRDYDKLANADLLPPLTASIAIVKERDAYRADAMRYRYIKNLCDGLKGVLRISHVDGTKDVLLMAVAIDHADGFLDNAIAIEKQK